MTKLKEKNDYFVPVVSDGCFRSFFRNEKILKLFLTDLLNIQIKHLVYLDTTMQKEYDKIKESRLDVIAELDDGTKINIEMQKSKNGDMLKRSIFYLSKMITRSIEEGEDYDNLTKHIAINILDYKDENYKTIKNCYKLINTSNKKNVSDILQIYMIALHEEGNISKELREWIEILNERESWNMKKYENHRLREAVETLKRLSRDPEVIALYDKEEKERLDQISRDHYIMRISQEEGLEQGKKQGKKETIFTNAINLYQNGVSKNIISKSLNITGEELDNILKDVA